MLGSRKANSDVDTNKSNASCKYRCLIVIYHSLCKTRRWQCRASIGVIITACHSPTCPAAQTVAISLGGQNQVEDYETQYTLSVGLETHMIAACVTLTKCICWLCSHIQNNSFLLRLDRSKTRYFQTALSLEVAEHSCSPAAML